jgi:hypothetical protein
MAKNLKEILFNAAKTSRQDIMEYGERSAIGAAAARNWWVYDNLLAAADLHDEFDKWENGTEPAEDEQLAEYGSRERTVTLTNDQWSRLTCYLLMSTKHRTGERDAWANLAEEKNPDGTPVFKSAASNAAYWQEIIDDLDAMMPKLDGLEG